MKLKYEFVITQIDEQSVAIPVGEASEEFNGIIRLNDTAKEIIEMLCEDTSLEEIVNSLYEKYNQTPKEEIKEYVEAFIESLKTENLIEE